MEVIVAKTAGFCFGVDKAVQLVYDSIEEKPLYTYGPIIHNTQVVEDMVKKGIYVIHELSELDHLTQGTIIIRSHGVGFLELETIQSKGFKIIDATCPYVKRIHQIVKKASYNHDKIIIIGNKVHPEVMGIKGWSTEETYVIEDELDVETTPWDYNASYSLVTQTTFNHIKYKEIVNKLHNYKIHVMIYETICNATEDRQKEAVEIAKIATKMIVIGGKHSSNTQKLYEICKKHCEQTVHIETIGDLLLNVFDDNDIIGITAGASTPKNIIEEVILNVRRAKFCPIT